MIFYDRLQYQVQLCNFSSTIDNNQKSKILNKPEISLEATRVTIYGTAVTIIALSMHY